MFSRPGLRNSEQIGQHLVDERPRDGGDRIDRFAAVFFTSRSSASASALKAVAIFASAFGESALAITGRTAV